MLALGRGSYRAYIILRYYILLIKPPSVFGITNFKFAKFIWIYVTNHMAIKTCILLLEKKKRKKKKHLHLKHHHITLYVSISKLLTVRHTALLCYFVSIFLWEYKKFLMIFSHENIFFIFILHYLYIVSCKYYLSMKYVFFFEYIKTYLFHKITWWIKC